MVMRSRLYLSAAFLLFPAAAHAQQDVAVEQTAPPETPPAETAGSDDYADDEAIVVTGARARGSVVGDIPPEEVLDARDVRATGATNINELIEALAPQLGSAQGRGGERPILLLNGQRISGFRELRDIPTEAIERAEILPEEVALKYGYSADQKVLNIVLRQRFRSTAVRADATAATEGGYMGGLGDITRLMIGRAGRTTINVHGEANGMLTESERNILLDDLTGDDPGDRSLLPTKRDLRASATANRTIAGNVSATLNGELEHEEGRSLLGFGDAVLSDLGRRTRTDSARAGLVLNGMRGEWNWNLTGNGELSRSFTRTDRDDLVFSRDSARQTRAQGELTALAHGELFDVPAGAVSATFRAGANSVHLDNDRLRSGNDSSSSLGRTAGNVAVNLDIPISRRNRGFSALGNLTANANAEVQQVSDFGTLTRLGGGANWSPLQRLNLLASWSREEGAPSIQQLGDPVLETPGTRIFDFTTGRTDEVTAISGGNRALDADRRSVLKFGANWQPMANTDLRLRGEYVRSRIDRPIQNIFGPTPALEAAFPERFTRDESGNLAVVDLRPINFDEAKRETLRIGLDFTKPLKSRRPSQSVIDQMRSQFRRERGDAPRGEAPPPPPSGEGGGSSGGFGGGRGFGGGGFFGGGNRGRLQFSLTDTIMFKDEVSIGRGLPVLDYLHGEAAGLTGGTPRHKVEAQAGWSNNGLGARVSANWRSGTRVNSLTAGDLEFSPLATVDLRLFANLGERPEEVLRHPWLRGTSLRFEVNNLLDSKLKVRDFTGATPINYQRDLIDPLGRTVMISFRKLFLPPRGSFRRDRGTRER